MARPPKKLSATSGQGVSRRSYQVGRSLGNSGSGSPGPQKLKDAPSSGGGVTASSTSTRNYQKSGPSSPWNIAFDESAERVPNLAKLKGYPNA